MARVRPERTSVEAPPSIASLCANSGHPEATTRRIVEIRIRPDGAGRPKAGIGTARPIMPATRVRIASAPSIQDAATISGGAGADGSGNDYAESDNYEDSRPAAWVTSKPQGGRRRLTINRVIQARKAARLAKAISLGGPGDACCRGVGPQQRRPHQF